MTSKFDLILLDADGTLLDFEKAQLFAITQTLEYYSLPRDAETIALYDYINNSYWEAMARGEVTKEELVVHRFRDLLRELKREGDPAAINSLYLENLGKGNFLLDGALELCRALAPHCTLAIATNGVRETQRQRIRTSLIAPYISHIIVSEEAGAAKPEKQFFDYAFQACGFSDKSRAVMIGDSLQADMVGGHRYGLTTCWICPEPVPETPPCVTHRVKRLEELLPIILPGTRPHS